MNVLKRAARIAVIATVLGTGVVTWSAVSGGASDTGSGPYQHGIVVVGDSITARYNDDAGSDRQAWWSFVGRQFDAQVRTYAQSGSGYQRPGLRCSGNRFIDRTEAFSGPPPSVFIIEGGRNDWASCREGRFVQSSDAAVVTAVDHYLSVVQKRLPASTRIIVLGPPWGPLAPWDGKRVTSIVHTAAERHGLEYVSTQGTLDSWRRVVDGIHPNRAGSEAIADRVIATLEQPPAA